MLWSAVNKMKQPDDIPQVHIVALWVALAALVIKELFSLYACRSNPSKIHYAGR
jgi:divalent metal cation (Fe/Co/Zn/Cd) transporter